MAHFHRSRHARVVVDVGLLIALRVAGILIGLIYIKIYVNRLEPEALGIFFYLATLSYLLNALLFVPFDYYLQTYCTRMGERLSVRPIAKMTAVVLTLALALVGMIGTILVAFGQLAVVDIASLYVVAVLLFGCTSLRNLLNNRGYRRLVAIALVLEAAGRVGAFLLLATAVAPSGRMLFASAAAALLIELILLIGFAAVRLPWTRSAARHAASPVIATTAPVSVAAACNLVQMQSYRTIYPWADVSTSAAVFAVVTNVGSAGMAAAGQVFSQMLLPRIYGTGGAYTRQYVILAASLTVAVSIVAWLAAPVLVALITSPRYSAHAGLVTIGVFIEGTNLIMTAITARSVLKDNTRRLMIWSIAGATTGATGYAFTVTMMPESPAAIGAALLLSQTVVLGGLAFDAFGRSR